MKIVYLEISTYRGISPEAVHFYGKVVHGNHEETMTHPLNRKQAAALNKEAQRMGRRMRHKPGSEHPGFDTRQDVIGAGEAYFKSNFDELADMLILGKHYSGEPQPVLIGPQELKDKINAWHKEAETIGWYDGGHRKRMCEISDAFWDIAQHW